MFRVFVLAGTALALVACASTEGAQGPPRDCFRTVDIDRYDVIDDQHVGARVSPQREYVLTLRQTARELDWTTAVELRSMTSFVCVGEGLHIELRAGDPARAYDVIRIERLPQTAPAGS